MRERLRKRPDLDQLKSGIDQCDRTLVARAITLIESKLPDDQKIASELLDAILPQTGKSIRIGITGVPGVGKSTFIEAFGSQLTAIGKKVAVLSIDPSSSRTRGSILGDKTRMTHLSNDPNAYIRPSPSGSSLGGVAQKTRESILICEAAGFDVILVETVGVGQSETAVKDMVDFFLLLMLAGGGDELQGIKRGIMEMADGLVINKADGSNRSAARQARKAYLNALHLFPPHPAGWQVPTLLCSAIQNEGLDACWEMITKYEQQTKSNGFFEQQRREQNRNWMQELVSHRLENDFFQQPGMETRIAELSEKVAAGELSVRHAVAQLFNER